MRAGSKGGRNRFCGQHRPDRQPIGQGFGQGHDIRFHSEVFIGEKLSGTSHAGLNFIKNQKRSGFVTDFSDRLQIFLIRAAHAAFALNGFQHDSTGGGPDLGLQGLCIVKGHKIKTIQNRIKPFSNFFLTGR